MQELHKENDSDSDFFREVKRKVVVQIFFVAESKKMNRIDSGCGRNIEKITNFQFFRNESRHMKGFVSKVTRFCHC
jgi:hypothetical protein